METTIIYNEFKHDLADTPTHIVNKGIIKHMEFSIGIYVMLPSMTDHSQPETGNPAHSLVNVVTPFMLFTLISGFQYPSMSRLGSLAPAGYVQL